MTTPSSRTSRAAADVLYQPPASHLRLPSVNCDSSAAASALATSFARKPSLWKYCPMLLDSDTLPLPPAAAAPLQAKMRQPT